MGAVKPVTYSFGQVGRHARREPGIPHMELDWIMIESAPTKYHIQEIRKRKYEISNQSIHPSKSSQQDQIRDQSPELRDQNSADSTRLLFY